MKLILKPITNFVMMIRKYVLYLQCDVIPFSRLNLQNDNLKKGENMKSVINYNYAIVLVLKSRNKRYFNKFNPRWRFEKV